MQNCNLQLYNIDGLMQQRRNSNALAMELHFLALTHRLICLIYAWIKHFAVGNYVHAMIIYDKQLLTEIIFIIDSSLLNKFV